MAHGQSPGVSLGERVDLKEGAFPTSVSVGEGRVLEMEKALDRSLYTRNFPRPRWLYHVLGRFGEVMVQVVYLTNGVAGSS